jgi:nucleotide-binding universal stress UspA family protein
LVAGGLEGSLHAAERAVDLSRLVGARLFVLTILQDPARSGGEDASRMAGLAAKYGVEHEELTAAGDPIEAILAAARKLRVDYVLLDAEGLTMPGGIPQEVLKRADRPVLLIGGGARTHDPVLPGHEAAPGETVG